jgi:hypothetical protein
MISVKELVGENRRMYDKIKGFLEDLVDEEIHKTLFYLSESEDVGVYHVKCKMITDGFFGIEINLGRSLCLEAIITAIFEVVARRLELFQNL